MGSQSASTRPSLPPPFQISTPPPLWETVISIFLLINMYYCLEVVGIVTFAILHYLVKLKSKPYNHDNTCVHAI